MEEHRDAAPALVADVLLLVGRRRLADRLEEESRVLQSAAKGLEREGPAREGHPQAVALLRGLFERERRRVADEILAVGIGLARQPDERLREVEPDDPVPAGTEVPADAALAAPDLQRLAAGLGHEREEGVAVAPVRVVVRRP